MADHNSLSMDQRSIVMNIHGMTGTDVHGQEIKIIMILFDSLSLTNHFYTKSSFKSNFNTKCYRKKY